MKLGQDEIAAQYKGLAHRRELKMRLRGAHRKMLKAAKRERWSAERLEAALIALPKKVLDKFRREQRDKYRNKYMEKRLLQGGAFESSRRRH
jgi:hypothetical protein